LPLRATETQLHLHKAAALLEHAVESLKHDHPYCRASLTALSSSVARVVVLASAVPSKLTSYATYTRAIVKTPAPPPRHSSQSSGRNTRSITTRKQRNRKRNAIVCAISVTLLDDLPKRHGSHGWDRRGRRSRAGPVFAPGRKIMREKENGSYK
jgi:hypothetical protein